MRNKPIASHPVFVSLMIGAAMCACRSRAGRPPAPDLIAKATPTQVVFVREMDPFPGVSEQDVQVSPAARSAFDTGWPKASGEIVVRTTTDELIRISRWAPALMSGYTPPPGWIDSLPMEPIGRTDRGEVVFGQRAQQSPVVLPSQSAIVHRRLIVAAIVDPAAGSIPRVYVTVRGWAEE